MGVEVSHNHIDHVPVGTLPELGMVPKKMHAWVIRGDRHGAPAQAFQKELIDVPKPGPGEVLVKVMAAGVNYNGIWAASGKPLSVLGVHKRDFHIAGSDASGIVWAVGPGVTRCDITRSVSWSCQLVLRNIAPA